MPLSLNKLEKLLTSKGLLPKKLFIMKGVLVYMEVLSLKNADSFMLYIPSKYSIEIDKGQDVHDLDYFEVTEDGHVPDDYAGEPDNFDIEKSYDEIDVDFSPDAQRHKNIEGHLEDDYNHPVALRDSSSADTQNLREIFRQLRRLKFCVAGIKYKVCIMYKDYLCCIDRYDEFMGYIAKNFDGPDQRKLFVSVDLETLFAKIDSIPVDIKTVREGIYKVLDKNQHKHMKNLRKMMEQKDLIEGFSKTILLKKKQYTRYLRKLEKLLTDINQSEQEIVNQIMEVEERYGTSDVGLRGLHTDIEKTHLISKHETELSRINSVKQELIRNILIIKTKHENLSLKIDNITFDNIVMIDAILKNFIKLTGM